MPETSLLGRRLMLVEDDYLLTSTLREALEREGASVVGPFPDVRSALNGIGDGADIDAALLDINLGGEMSFSVADALRDHGIPVLLVSGYDHDTIPAEYEALAHCRKPFSVNSLIQKINEIAPRA